VMGCGTTALVARGHRHEHEGSVEKSLGNRGRIGTHPRAGSTTRRWRGLAGGVPWRGNGERIDGPRGGELGFLFVF
jgi:hypothetical protein